MPPAPAGDGLSSRTLSLQATPTLATRAHTLTRSQDEHPATGEPFVVSSQERVELAADSKEARTMEFLVNMTTQVPEGISEDAIQDIRTREAARSRELAAQGRLLRLWRPPLQPGEWRTLGLFAADDAVQLEEVLASMPLRVWRTDDVTPLSPHPNDPAMAHNLNAGPRAPGQPRRGRNLGVQMPATGI